MKQFKCWVLNIVAPTGKMKKVFSPSYKEATMSIDSFGKCLIQTSNERYSFYLKNDVASIESFLQLEGNRHCGIAVFQTRELAKNWYNKFKLQCQLDEVDCLETFKTGVTNAVN